MLIHGLGEGAYIWTDLARHLPSDYSAFAVDLRGHGRSPRSADGRYVVDHYVADVVAALDSLGLERVILIGHSLGGDVVTRIATEHSERIAALVVVDCGMESGEPGRRMVLNLWYSLRVYATAEEYLQWLTRLRPLVSPELLKHCVAEALKGSEETGFTLRVDPAVFLRPNHPRKDNRDWAILPRIKCPTLILRGANSAVLPKAVAIRMATTVPNCSLQEIEKAGHAVMLENPSAFREQVFKFLLQVRDIVL